MKKFVFISAGSLIVGALLSPVAGMAINGTRSLILGLAPEDAILTLADEIDSSKADQQQSKSEMQAKTTELQSLIDDQQNQITEQQSIIDEQSAELDKQKSATTQAQNTADQTRADVAIANEKSTNCNKLLSSPDAKNCESSHYSSKSNYESFSSALESDEDKQIAKRIFNKCEEIRAACN
ncbi:MAG: hypothetical protein ABIC19_00590 [Patescibacteria group bacterium]|nr:hypothetical protein [Patescibacteria group bacterium]